MTKRLLEQKNEDLTMTMTTETAILAGGCFWGMQDLIRKLPGVTSTRVGYSGGDVANATYRNHGSHAEAIEVKFDPAVLSFRRLLEFFFQVHDPSTPNRQGNDLGESSTKKSRQTRLLTLMPVACGREKWSQSSRQPGLSGRQNLNTKITWSASLKVTPATMCALTGDCHNVQFRKAH
jgi:hypothetical protein